MIVLDFCTFLRMTLTFLGMLAKLWNDIIRPAMQIFRISSQNQPLYHQVSEIPPLLYTGSVSFLVFFSAHAYWWQCTSADK